MTRNHLLSASVLLMMSMFGAASAHAQTEGWLRGPGSATGKDSKVVNPASDTKARPYYKPFND